MKRTRSKRKQFLRKEMKERSERLAARQAGILSGVENDLAYQFGRRDMVNKRCPWCGSPKWHPVYMTRAAFKNSSDLRRFKKATPEEVAREGCAFQCHTCHQKFGGPKMINYKEFLPFNAERQKALAEQVQLLWPTTSIF